MTPPWILYTVINTNRLEVLKLEHA